MVIQAADGSYWSIDQFAHFYVSGTSVNGGFIGNETVVELFSCPSAADAAATLVNLAAAIGVVTPPEVTS